MMPRQAIPRAGTLFALSLCVTALAFAFAIPARAQDGDTVIKVVAPAESFDVDEQFEVQVVVENVEHLASFSFDLQYDPLLIQPIVEGQQTGDEPSPEPTETGDEETNPEPTETSEDDAPSEPVKVLGDDVGLFLTTSERSENIICEGPATVDKSKDGVHDTVRVFCVTPGLPVCLGGPEGASGSGVLASVLFDAVDAGETVLQISESTFALDDVPECDIDQPTAIEIPHAQEGATINIEGGSFPWLLVGIIAGAVVAVIVVGGLGAIALGSRRKTGDTP